MTGTLLYTLRFLLVGIAVIAGLFMLSFLLSSTEAGHVQAQDRASAKPLISGASNSPNAVTSGAVKAINGSVRALDSTVYAISGGVQSAATVTAQAGKTVAGGVQTAATATVRGIASGLAAAGRTVGTGAAFAGRAIGGGTLFIVRIPGNALGFAANATGVGMLIRPSDHVEVPIIDPHSAELQTAITALPPAEKTDQPTPGKKAGPQWPMHGRVTTEFGVDHWPFQHTHTGMDISSGQSSPIKPFRPGKVIDTVRSNRGLGNHVIVDHGNGVTSVYAHLSSIAVREGQNVGLETTLGIEGTTGVSTGNHLHLEIRVNGQAANPRQFIGGQP